MYQPLPTDVSGRDYQEEMRTMLTTMIPVFELYYSRDNQALVELGPSLVKEMNDMLEFAGHTVISVEDRAQAILDYLNYHYSGAAKPDWYATLTGGV